MTITVTEHFESGRLAASRDGRASTFDMVMNVTGTDDPVLAKNAAVAFSPEVWGTGFPRFWRQTVEVEPIGQELWRAVARYDTTAPETPSAEDSWEFETSGGTEHITQSLATVGAYPSGVADYQGAIGVTENGVEGVDKVVPTLTFRETHHFAELAPAYKITLANLTGKVNADTFRGFAPGEVLFLGVSARLADNRAATPWSVTYQFAAQATRRNFTVGAITVEEKLGWDYMWVRYQASVASGQVVRRPVAVYVERVYEFAPFAALGIGI